MHVCGVPLCISVCVLGEGVGIRGCVSRASREKEESQTADHFTTHPNMYRHMHAGMCALRYFTLLCSQLSAFVFIDIL